MISSSNKIIKSIVITIETLKKKYELIYHKNVKKAMCFYMLHNFINVIITVQQNGQRG